jgi:hypothetical protein
MRAVRLHRYHEDPSIDEIPEPQITARWTSCGAPG